MIDIMSISELRVWAVQSFFFDDTATTETLCERLHKCFDLTAKKLHWEAAMQKKWTKSMHQAKSEVSAPVGQHIAHGVVSAPQTASSSLKL